MSPEWSPFADALVLTGPTASGKSGVALELAERLGCAIVAMDSMTLYRGLDIGTAKPTASERERVSHHLLDRLDPWESGSAAWWLREAALACGEIRVRRLRPLFVGGTPFFLKALLYGLFDSPEIDPVIRARLEVEGVRPEELHLRLARVDPVAAARLHANDVRRVIRALEVFEGTGKPISDWQNSWKDAALPIPVAALDWPRDALNDRIDTRIDAMLAAGWLDEARRLRELPKPLGREASQALGYRDLFAFLDGEVEWDATVANIKLHTRQFAKRQRTWFRGLKECVPVSGEGEGVADRVLAAWGRLG